MTRTILLATSLLALGCGAEAGTDAPDALDPLGGKADEFTSPDNTLTLTGDVERTIRLDDAFQCEGNQFTTLASWRNRDDRGFEFPSFRITMTHPGGFALIPGDVIDLTLGTNRAGFDGIGYSTSGELICDVTVADFYNEGQGGRFGLALDFDGCELVREGRRVTLSGTVGCEGTGYDQLFDPGPRPDPTDPADPTDPTDPTEPTNPTDPTEPTDPVDPVQDCSDEEYIGWMDQVQGVVDGSGSIIDADDQAEIDEAIAARPCVGTSDALYTEWIGRLDDALDDAGRIIDDRDAAALDAVFALAPETRSPQAFLDWFALYTELFSRFLPSNTSVLDENEAAKLTRVHDARPEGADATGTDTWMTFALERFAEIAPSASSIVDANETLQLDELVAQRPAVHSSAAFDAFMATYDDLLTDVIPSGTGSYEDKEGRLLDAYARLRPVGGSDAAWARWASGFGAFLDHVGPRAREGAVLGLEHYVSVMPCAQDPSSEVVLAASAELPDDLGEDDPRATALAQATPKACE